MLWKILVDNLFVANRPNPIYGLIGYPINKNFNL